MNKRDFYYKEIVSQATMDEAFGWCEAADQALAEDAALTGVVSALVASETSPASMSISLTGPGLAYDKAGQRCAIAANPTVLSCSVDEYGVPTTVTGVGNERWLGVFVRFKRTLTDPEIDGNGLSVYTREWEGAEVFVRQGTEATIGAALKVPLQSEAILLCDVRLVRLQTTVTNSDILVTRREDWSRCVTTSFGTKVAGTSKAAVTALWSAVDTAASGGGPFTPSSTWYGAIPVAGSAPPITTVGEAINAIIYDLAYINPGLGVNGAQKISMPAYASTYVNWPDCSLAYAVTVTGGLLNNHIAGSAPYHPATAVSFSDTAMKAKWGSQATATTVQAALDRITQSLTETGGTPPYPAGATLVRNAALTGYLTETIGASNLNSQLTGFMNLLIDRAHKTLPTNIETNWHHTHEGTNEDDQDFRMGGEFAKSRSGGGLHPKATFEDVICQNWESWSAYAQPYAYTNSCRGIDDADACIVDGCVVFISHDTDSHLPDPVMRVRRLVLADGQVGKPNIYIVDPTTGEATLIPYTTITAALPSGTWRIEAICSIRGGSFAIMVANDVGHPTTSHRIQAFTISSSGGSLVVAKHTGWPATGTLLPGAGGNSWEITRGGVYSVTAARCILAGGSQDKIITLNGWNDSAGSDILTRIAAASGALEASGRGDATSSASRYPTNGLATTGGIVFFTTMDGSNNGELNHASVSNLASHVLINMPINFTGTDADDAPWSVACDGTRVYTGITSTGEMACYEISTQIGAIIDMSGFAVNYREVKADGRNVWWLGVQAVTNYVNAFRVRAASFPTLGTFTAFSYEYAIHSICIAALYPDPTTWQFLGPFIFDGDSMWTILNTYSGKNESRKVRRVPRCQDY